MHSSLIEKLKDQTNIFFHYIGTRAYLVMPLNGQKFIQISVNLFQAMINKAFMLL